MDERLGGLRRDYTSAVLDVADVFADPMVQFHKWFDEALSADVLDVEAMVLSTASADGVPSGRVVLLRQASERGFVFYTNYTSAKGADLESNPRCSLTFHWRELER